jgi:hypothetical protein
MRKYFSPSAPLVWAITGALAALLPLCLLFRPGLFSYNDWINHTWQVGYYGEYFRAHGSFPTAYNTHAAVALAFPVFYGVLFYPVLGLFAAFFPPMLVLQAAVVVVQLAQFAVVFGTFRRLGRSARLAFSVACLVSWAIYPLSNLYNRNAIPELVATHLVSILGCLWLRMVYLDPPERAPWRIGWFGLLWTFMAGTHPITAVYGSAALLVLIGATVRDWWRTHLTKANCLTLAGVVAGAVLALAHWVLAVFRYQKKLYIVEETMNFFMIPSIDNLLTRFFPVPFDIRSELSPLGVSTPYLDTQLNVPLLLLALLLLAAARASVLRHNGSAARWLGLFSLLGFAGSVFWSTVEGRALLGVPGLLKYVQLAYRLVSYQNFFLLTGTAALFLSSKNRALPGWVKAGAAACLVLSGAGLISKLQRVKPPEVTMPGMMKPYFFEDRNRYVVLPDGFYGVRDYVVRDGLIPIEGGQPYEVASFPVYGGKNFGKVGKLTLQAESSIVLVLNYLPFPWNRLVLDGKPLSLAEIRLYEAQIAVKIPKGNHSLTLEHRPDPAWLFLRRLALWGLFAWAALLAAHALVIAWGKMRRAFLPSRSGAAAPVS